MAIPALAPAAAPMGVASAEAAQDLHPREWAARQTALTNAQHRALNAVVQAYTPFQLQYGEFYIVESFVQPYLSIAYRTFRNYLSALNKLGVLELIWRAPNQHGDKSVWRMRLDVVLSAGQMALPIEEMEVASPEPPPRDELGAERQTAMQVEEFETRAAPDDESLRAVLTEAEGQGWRYMGKKAIEQMTDEEIKATLARMRVQFGDFARELERRETEAAVNAPNLTRAQRRRLEKKLRKGRSADRSAAPALAGRGKGKAGASLADTDAVRMREVQTGDARAGSELAREVDRLLRESFELPPLREAEVSRVARMEEDWSAGHSGEPVAAKFVEYAAGEAAKHAKSDFTGYMLKVLEASLRRGYRGRVPDASVAEGFLRKHSGSSGDKRKPRAHSGSGDVGASPDYASEVADPPDWERLHLAHGEQISSAHQTWDAALALLRRKVARPAFETWLSDTRGYAHVEGLFVVGAANSFATEMMKNRLHPVIEKALEDVWGTAISVEYVAQPDDDGSCPICRDAQQEAP